jgi:hypothetical protein
MPCVLLPEVMKQQAKLERQLARQRRGEVGCDEKDTVVEWYCARMREQGADDDELCDPSNYEAWSYKEFYEYIQDLYPSVPERIWNYFELSAYILDLVRDDDNHTLVFYDPTETNPQERIFEFGEVQSILPAWAGKQHQWFIDHPFKHNFYVLRNTA